MNHEILASLLSKLPSSEDKEEFLEAMTIIGDDVSRQIIAKAASPHSPVSIDEFPNISETTMVRHLDLLERLEILKPVWENNIRKSAITDIGRQIAQILGNNEVTDKVN